MYTILGLDVSTACVGVAIVAQPDVLGALPIINMLEHIEFKHYDEDVWSKIDHFHDVIEGWVAEGKLADVTHVFIEDPALRFTMGKSSASTLAVLIRYNALCSYVCYSLLALRPEYISVAHARKLCGIKIQRKSKCGIGAKEQTFNFMQANDLKHVVFPMKKRTKKTKGPDKPVDWAMDVVDAYVVARAGLLTVDVRTEQTPSLL